MSIRTRSLVLALVLTGAVLAGTCAGPARDDEVSDGSVWAARAESYFAAMTESFCCEADFESAAFFLPSGSFDFRMFGGLIATTAEEVANSLEYHLTGPDGTRGEVVLDDLYLSADGAIGSYRLIDDNQTVFAWAALYSFDGPNIAGRVYSFAYGDGVPAWTPLLDEGTEIYDRYLTAWSQPDPETIAAVYSPSAVVEDTLLGRTWSGRDAIVAGIDDEAHATIEAGPWPNLMSFHLDGRSEFLAVVQTTGACPRLEARRWFSRDGLIVRDVRYQHVPSARRCDLDLNEGWWDDLGPPDLARGVSNLKISIDGDVVEVVNAEWEQLEFVRWVFERYRLGLDNPHVEAVWFPPSLDCSTDRSFASSEDRRFDGGHSVTFCVYDDEFLDRRSGSRWLPNVVRTGLHEFAHVWIYDHLSPADRAAFMQRAGVSAWRTGEWGDRGVEQAAETIAWGLSGNEYDTYEISPRPACAELSARYELLTGRRPLTTCG